MPRACEPVGMRACAPSMMAWNSITWAAVSAGGSTATGTAATRAAARAGSERGKRSMPTSLPRPRPLRDHGAGRLVVPPGIGVVGLELDRPAELFDRPLEVPHPHQPRPQVVPPLGVLAAQRQGAAVVLDAFREALLHQVPQAEPTVGAGVQVGEGERRPVVALALGGLALEQERVGEHAVGLD